MFWLSILLPAETQVRLLAMPWTCVVCSSIFITGGGFLGGSSAQEESLARCSGLYSTLTQPEVRRLITLRESLYELSMPVQMQPYYVANRRTKTGFYTDYLIYSPNGEAKQIFG